MQYIHKLARRLALSRGVALGALMLVAGCESDMHEGSDPLGTSPIAAPATRLVLADHPSDLEVDEELQLSAFGLSIMGREAPVQVVWTASGGTIDSAGRFSASAPGSYTVYVRGRTRKDLVDSTSLAVSRQQVTRVEIEPAHALIAAGAKQVFVATGYRRDGTAVPVDVRWRVTGGTIDSTGAYQAPDVPGSYQVIARRRRGPADTAIVDVTVPDGNAPVASVVLTPASVTLAPGAVQPFTVSALLDDGSPAPVSVTYQATGGAVTADGLYTAGQTPGAFRVIAVAGTGQADTSAVAIEPGAPAVEQVLLTPATVTLAPGAGQQFSATARLSNGSTVPADVTYNVTGGTVTSGGLYTAGEAPGAYRVIALAANGLADTSAVSVAEPAPGATLREIVLTPAAVTLPPGGAHRFSAVGKLSDGSTSAVAVVYSATGGTMAGDGLYTAGAAGGSYRVIARHDGGTLADTAAVVIAVPGTSGQRARMADSLVETISVQTHLSYNNVYTSGWASIIRPRLLELGVRHIRERMVESPTVQARMRDLAANGVRLTAGCWPQNQNYGDASHCIARANAYGPDVISAFDGWNEVDNKGSGWPAAWIAWQKTLWNTYKAHPTWRTRPLYANSLAHAAGTDQLGNQSAFLDAGNMHSYPAGDVPSVVSKAWIPKWTQVSGSKPLAVTETGYHTCVTCSTNGVSYTAQSKYLGRLIFEYFNRGIVRTNLYELIDEGVSTTSREDNWGLVRNDGQPKPSFTTIKNLIALLSDKGDAFAPERLDYSLAGALSTTHSTLLQKRDRRFYLVLWQEVRSWDIRSRRDVPVANDDVTLTLGSDAREINVYRPSGGTQPIRTGSGSRIELSVPDELLVVEIVP